MMKNEETLFVIEKSSALREALRLYILDCVRNNDYLQTLEP